MNPIAKMNRRGDRAFTVLETSIVAGLIATLAVVTGHQATGLIDNVQCLSANHSARYAELTHLVEDELGEQLDTNHGDIDAKLAAVTDELSAALDGELDMVDYHQNADGTYTVTVDDQQITIDPATDSMHDSGELAACTTV